MPPKGGNAKKESGRAKKAENEAKKKGQAEAVKETKEAADWSSGAKGTNAKAAAAEDKRKADLARKAESARLLAEEEASAPSKPKATPKAGAAKAKVAQKPAGPGAIAAGGDVATTSSSATREEEPREEPESYAATGIDNALDLLEVVTTKTDKASVGSQAAGIERHPERRYKAAFEAYSERELPNLKVDHPGLRLNQYKELLHKQFQKSPENPFNQSTVDYNATKEQKVDALNKRKTDVENRLRE